jgi:hypothetical protein
MQLGLSKMVNQGDYDGFVARFDSKGKCEWSERFGGAGYDYGHGIAMMKEGDLVVSGAISGEGSAGSNTVGKGGARSAFLARVNDEGEWIWAKGLVAPSISGHQVNVGSDDSIFLAGYSRGEVTWSDQVSTESKVQDVFAAKFDRDGEFKWVRAAGGKSDGVATSIAVDNETGNVAIAGMFKGEAVFGAKTFTSQGGHDFFTSILSGSGDSLGAFHGAGGGTDYGLDIAAGKNGFVATGEFSGSADFAGKKLSGAGEREAWVARFAADGSRVEAIQVLGGIDHDLSYAVTATTDGAVVIAGAFRKETSMGESELKSVGGNDLVVTKLQLTK